MLGVRGGLVLVPEGRQIFPRSSFYENLFDGRVPSSRSRQGGWGYRAHLFHVSALA